MNVNSHGSWAHMHANSGGKMILAHLLDDEVDDRVDRHSQPAKTDQKIEQNVSDSPKMCEKKTVRARQATRSVPTLSR